MQFLMSLRSRLLIAVLLGLSSVSAQGQPQAQAWQIETFDRPQVTTDQPRLRVRVGFEAIERASRDRAELGFLLPTGRLATARLEFREEFETGVVSTGPLTDGAGTASVSMVGDTLTARIVVDGQLWMVRREKDSHILERVDESSFGPELEPLPPPADSGVSDAGSGGAADVPPTAGDASTVDLLVVYTPAALARFGTLSALTTEVNLGVSNANVSLANAGLAHRFRLVQLSAVSYTEAGSATQGDSGTDLSRLRATSDGILDDVHALRDSVGADVVTLLTQAPVPDACGVGYVMTTNSSSFAPFAFNVVIATCAGANLTLAHEIGHNMGLHHDVANAGTCNGAPCQGVTSYAYGYRIGGVGRTVMAYACESGPACARAQVFSTPTATFSNGAPAGVADAADNARALNLTFATTAAYRTAASACSYSASPTSFAVSAAAGTATVTVTTTSSCPWGADVGSTGIVPTQTVLQGNGSVSLAYPANTGAARALTVAVAGQTITINQAASCTVSLTGSPTSMSYAGGAGSLVVTIASACSGTWALTSNQSWLTFPSSSSGTASGNVAFSVAANTGTSPVARTATITLTLGSATATFFVLQTPPTLTVTPDPIVFAAVRDGVQPIGLATPEQEVSLTWSGATAPVWTATVVANVSCPTCPSTSWVRLTGASGTGSATLRVAVADTLNVLAAHSLALATIRVSAPGFATTDVTVRLSIAAATAYSVPFGFLDSPTEGATGLSGSIAVGGWALDDLAVERVEIHRLAVASDPAAAIQAGGLVYLGRALFVAGARPDVLAAYGAGSGATTPLYPQAQRAGWGLLVLTNALPHQGNGTPTGGQGTFTFVAIAVDVEGRSAELGRRTVTINNDAAVVPFGAIDTPGQGGTVPDTAAPYNNVASYPVFGWALSPGGVCIATSGATIDVLVDGAVVGNPTYNLNRADIAAGYPGYCNSTGAVGVYYLNASGLSDGLHTIAWRVRDASGRTAEIGSRYFRVSKGMIQ
jgi:Metallo-peptidase family M12B Reprolysin-like/Putative binding domain, N-terminal